MGCDHEEATTPELDAAVAREAMRKGDWGHAAFHVAAALSYDPLRPDLLALLAELVDRVGSPEETRALYPLEGGTWFGAAAVHARLLAGSDPDAAFGLLCRVAVARPDLPWLAWAEPWLPTLEPDAAGRSLSGLLRAEVSAGTPGAEHLAGPALALLETLGARHPAHAVFAWLAAILARRAGHLAEALALAEAAALRFPSWNTGVALANARRELGDFHGAEDAWRMALAHDPTDRSVRLDWADQLLDRGELDAARAKYQEVLDLEPGHPWATPSADYVDWRRRPTAEGRLRLEAWARAHPDARRGRQLADHATPGVGWLPDPGEATFSALEAAADAGTPVSSIAVTEAESPSGARAAFEATGAWPTGPRTASPSPEAPRTTERWTPLWRFTGGAAEPTLPPPPEAVAVAVAARAAAPFSGRAWLAGELPGRAPELVSAALYPPPPPGEFRAWRWRWRVVHAVAFALAGRHGWARTPHRDALRTFLATRCDWTAAAAAAAVALRGVADPEVRTEVVPILRSILTDDRPSVGGWCLQGPVAQALWTLADRAEDRSLAAAHLVEREG